MLPQRRAALDDKTNFLGRIWDSRRPAVSR